MPRRLARPGTACVLVVAVYTVSTSKCVCGAHGVRVCGASLYVAAVVVALPWSCRFARSPAVFRLVRFASSPSEDGASAPT
eukprot:11549991-Alexandrium_andersonii.AAC.1